ncbi:unnamed protein product [Moneuplotes crassus]|uniref:Peptidase M1 leukotriene A4 hydrolase/aminopeptidase C-terminal domain-containing protein n=2 Tax=Euplotes crassus TaxID=5936 RepID=A0AAD1U3D5_EUPCR|nr:unnamed protein product [Moneuplotes crassus]
MKAAIAIATLTLIFAGLVGYHSLLTNYSQEIDMHADDAIIDNSTNANVHEVATQHLHLNLTLEFDRKVAYGTATHTMKALVDNLNHIDLDARYLNIGQVKSQEGKNLKFHYEEPNPNIGPKLVIEVSNKIKKDDIFNITIEYETTDKTLSLNWLDPEQTAGNTLPYVFTHCEAIDCRTLAPLQDTPSVKSTYSALIRSPRDIKVYMSAVNLGDRVEGNSRVTEFSLDVPIPSYLIALVAGDLEYKKLGRNTGVITEPVFMKACVDELSELQDSLDVAESFLTEYEWGMYTIVVLPPSFPFGGMENPLLTFASPTIIVGDKSQVNVASHEIAHSWTGNLVTNRNWENFWLNEGFTMWSERAIIRKQRGEEFYRVASALGNSSLYDDLNLYGYDSTFTSLHPNYAGANPYDTFSDVPYEKGFLFLTYIETLMGTENFEVFLRFYLEKYRRQSIVYSQFIDTFLEFLDDNFSEQERNKIVTKIDFHTWIFGTGPPPVQLNFSTPNLEISRELADAYLLGNGTPKNYDVFFGYFSLLKCIFLQRLVDRAEDATIPILEQIDKDYTLTTTIDPEQKYLWLQLCIMAGYDKAIPFADEFLGQVGRQKYLLPLYRALKDYDINLAIQIFNKHKLGYHPVAVVNVGRILGV